jgi:hypothetical protein
MELPSTLEKRLQTVPTLSSELPIVCPGCGKSFTPRRPNHQYCSATCRVVWFQRKTVLIRQDRDAMLRLLLRQLMDRVQDGTDAQLIREALALLEPLP